MPNRLDRNTRIGTIGELLVQIKLLTLNIESFPPLKDSGTDLVAFLGKSYKVIQVKTKKDSKYWNFPPPDKTYDILALVDLNEELLLDKSMVWLLTKKEAEENRKNINSYDYYTLDKKFRFSEPRIKEIWNL